MRITILTTMALLAGLTAIGASLPAQAQPAQPPTGHPGMGGPQAGPGTGRNMGGMRRPPIDPSLFALMYRPDDRQLTPPDVQKIAESILLWFGNRTWKVAEVGPDGEGKIKFAYATAEGSVIARFTMDTKTGRIVRTG